MKIRSTSETRRRFATMFATCAVVALGSLALAPEARADSPPVQPEPTLMENFNGWTSALTSDGCINTQTSFQFRRDSEFPGGTTSLYASVGVMKWDWCTDSILVLAEAAPLSDVTFTLSRNAGSARGVGHATATNSIDGNALHIDVDVSFVLSDMALHHGQPPFGQPVYVASGGGTVEGSIVVNDADYTAQEGTFDSFANTDYWFYVL